MVMLDKLFGSKIAAYVLLYIYHYGEIHLRALAKGIGVSVSAVKNQLNRFEEAGVIASKEAGRTRLFFFNKKSPMTKYLMEMIQIVHTQMSFEDKEELFSLRMRPRRSGKPVVGRESR